MAVIEAVAAERGCELFVPDFGDLSVEPLAERPCAGSRGRGGDSRRVCSAATSLSTRRWPSRRSTCCAGAGGPSPTRPLSRASPPPVGPAVSKWWAPRRLPLWTVVTTLRGPRPWPPRSPIFWGRRDAPQSTLLWACWPTRTTRPWCASWRRGPAASRCTPRKPSRPGGRRAGGLRARRLWWKRAGPMTCPCARAALPPMPCAQPATPPARKAASSPSAPFTPSPISWARCSELAVCENDLMHEKGRPRKSALRKCEKPADRRVP